MALLMAIMCQHRVTAPEPTRRPTASPTMAPTWRPGWPTPSPTDPTAVPTRSPTAVPTYAPTPDPTADPTYVPTPLPTTASPTYGLYAPTPDPTVIPTAAPTQVPTANPTPDPTRQPTYGPGDPTPAPTMTPTFAPTPEPSYSPTPGPSYSPTLMPNATPAPSAQPSTVAPSVMPSHTPTSKPTVETPLYLQEEFYASLPLYAKILFTFAVVSVGCAISFFAYKKIYKPRLELQRRRAYMASGEDCEGFMDEVASPVGHTEEWSYAADDSYRSGHSPVRIKLGRMRHGRSRVASGATNNSGEVDDADPLRFQFSPVPREDSRRGGGHAGDGGESTHASHFHNLLQNHDGSGHFGY